ncbi:MAG TPA: shikimate kinase [Desulfobulbaceae bacterium]|nr:shikimate kinase [Desulfobulbaceae bacterium]
MMKKRSDTSVAADKKSPVDRIILTGFRATGKSLVGRMLADRLGLDFCDTDTLLCTRSGLSVREFVDRFGWPDFRRMEEQLLLRLRHRSSVVIATGGGAILHEQAWRSLRKKSIIFWLRADCATIEQRLSLDENSYHLRPSLTGGDLPGEIREQLALRSPLYRRGADIVIDTDGRSPSELVREMTWALTTAGGR